MKLIAWLATAQSEQATNECCTRTFVVISADSAEGSRSVTLLQVTTAVSSRRRVQFKRDTTRQKMCKKQTQHSIR